PGEQRREDRDGSPPPGGTDRRDDGPEQRGGDDRDRQPDRAEDGKERGVRHHHEEGDDGDVDPASRDEVGQPAGPLGRGRLCHRIAFRSERGRSSSVGTVTTVTTPTVETPGVASPSARMASARTPMGSTAPAARRSCAVTADPQTRMAREACSISLPTVCAIEITL